MEHRLAASLLMILLLISAQVFACFVYYEPEDFAKACPIIVAGIITETDKSSAYIKVNRVFKNVLKDVKLKRGDILPVRMSPILKEVINGEVFTAKSSIDIRYDKGTEGIWLIALYDKTHGFAIHRHPVQHQSLADEGILRTKGVFLAEEAILPNGKTAVKLYSTDEWLVKIKQEEVTREEARRASEMRFAELMAAPVVAGSSVAQDPYDSGQNLYTWSKEYRKPDGQSDKNRFDAGVFIGYVSGIRVVRNGDTSIPSLAFCTPATVTKSQLCDVVAKYVEKHPEERGTSSAESLVALALAKAFPCEKR